MAELTQAKVNEFQKGRQQLLAVSSQKRQLQAQLGSMKNALKELKESKPKTVFKAVGNILLEKKAKDVKKELKESKEKLDARVSSLQKQEDSLVNKLNKLKAELEEQTGALNTAIPKKEKKSKKKKK